MSFEPLLTESRPDGDKPLKSRIVRAAKAALSSIRGGVGSRFEKGATAMF
jgi:hypothetical protein